MHEDRVGLGAAPSAARRPGRASAGSCAGSRSLVAHRHPGVGDDAIGAARPPRSGSSVTLDRRALALRPVEQLGRRLQLLRAGEPQLEAEARRGMDPAASATLLPSPLQAIVRPSIGPFCSSKVITSAMIWQGWDASVRPLITGTVACARELVERLVRSGADHDRIDIARQHPRRVGDGLAAAELHVVPVEHDRRRRRAGASPTSKETRVRVDGFSKIIASILPSSGRLVRGLRPLRAALHARAASRIARSVRRRMRRDRGNAVARIRGCAFSCRAIRPARLRTPLQRDAGFVERSSTPRRSRVFADDSGGSRRTTLSPAPAPSSPCSRAAATNIAVRDACSLRPSSRPCAAHLLEDVGMLVLQRGEALLAA